MAMDTPSTTALVETVATIWRRDGRILNITDGDNTTIWLWFLNIRPPGQKESCPFRKII
jgi:hypothetical protein